MWIECIGGNRNRIIERLLLENPEIRVQLEILKHEYYNGFYRMYMGDYLFQKYTSR